ncbi:MAG: hypothetical protein U0136_04870 [Bdellovibrionota bacterium]
MFSVIMNELVIEDRNTPLGVVTVVTFRDRVVSEDRGNVKLFASDLVVLAAECQSRDARRIVFDCSRLQELAWNAIKALAQFRRKFQGTKGSDVRLCCLCENVDAVFNIGCWRRRFVRYPTLDAALANSWDRRSPWPRKDTAA